MLSHKKTTKRVSKRRKEESEEKQEVSHKRGKKGNVKFQDPVSSVREFSSSSLILLSTQQAGLSSKSKSNINVSFSSHSDTSASELNGESKEQVSKIEEAKAVETCFTLENKLMNQFIDNLSAIVSQIEEHKKEKLAAIIMSTFAIFYAIKARKPGANILEEAVFADNLFELSLRISYIELVKNLRQDNRNFYGMFDDNAALHWMGRDRYTFDNRECQQTEAFFELNSYSYIELATLLKQEIGAVLVESALKKEEEVRKQNPDIQDIAVLEGVQKDQAILVKELIDYVSDKLTRCTMLSSNQKELLKVEVQEAGFKPMFSK